MSELDGSKLQPSLIIKANSQILKYLIREKEFAIVFSVLSPNNHLMYGVQINDDPVAPAVIWSIVEREEELDSICAFLQASACPVYLFNEVTANVCWSPVKFVFKQDSMCGLLSGINLCPANMLEKYESTVGKILDNSRGQAQDSSKLVVISLAEKCSWHEVNNYYLTNRGGHSRLSIITGEEGNQQEEIGVWFLDNLSLSGAVKNPVVYESGKPRELSDIMVNYQEGCFLVESKSLTIFARDNVPNRCKLINGVYKHLVKAVSQLKGACRNVHAGNRVTDLKGNDIELNRKQPIHCIVLIPDLSLLDEVSEFGVEVLKPFMIKTKSFLHVLDPNELKSCVGSALRLSEMSKKISPVMAFDYVLLKRFKCSCKNSSPHFRFLIKTE